MTINPAVLSLMPGWYAIVFGPYVTRLEYLGAGEWADENGREIFTINVDGQIRAIGEAHEFIAVAAPRF